MWSVLDTGSAVTTVMRESHRAILDGSIEKGSTIELYDGKRVVNKRSHVRCLGLGSKVVSVNVQLPQPGQDGNMYTQYSFLGTNALRGRRLILLNMSVLRQKHGVPEVWIE